MNDLLSDSFEIRRGQPSGGRDIELGANAPTSAGDQGMGDFFKKVQEIEKQNEKLDRLLRKLQDSHEESKAVTKAPAMKAIKQRMEKDVDEVGKVARYVKTKVEELDRENLSNRQKLGCGKGSGVDRSRTATTLALKKKLKDKMTEFQILREKIHQEYRDVVERRVFTVTGARADEETIEKLIETGDSEQIFQKAIQEQGRGQVMDTLAEIHERHSAVRELERKLLELQQVFLDMAVLVEAQGDMLDNIESHVTSAVDHVQQGNTALQKAKKLQKNSRKWMCIAIIILLIIVVVIVVGVLKPWNNVLIQMTALSFLRPRKSAICSLVFGISPQVFEKFGLFCPKIVKSFLNPCAHQSHIQSFWRVFPLGVLYSTQSSKLPEYEMPTVTWGAVQGRKEKLVSRVIICDYLKSLGIVPDELEHLELPSTVEVMRERVEFLQKLGLTIDDINEFPLILGCSVRKNMIPVLGYLEKIGIPRPKLGEFIKNYPQVLHASVIVELAPVIKLLRGLDVEKEDIGYVLQKYPELLGFKLEGTMSTSVAYLVSIGVNPRDIGPMVTQYPFFLGMRVGTMIKPLVEFIVSLGLPKKIVARMLEKRAYILGYDLGETVKPNIDCLLSFGIRKELLPSVIAQYPLILGLPLKAKMSSQQFFFDLKLKIDPAGFAQVIEKMPQMVSLHQHVIIKPAEFLLERGIASSDVAKMIVQCPQLLACRVPLMKNSYYFFKSDMGRPIKELVDFPEYFTYSLESRIKPRYQRLQSKGISCSLNWFLNCSDQRFEERLKGEFIETESLRPSFCMGGRLELPSNETIVSDDEDECDEQLHRRIVSL